MKKLILLLIVFIILAGIAAAVLAYPYQNKTTLTWDEVTTNVDGTPVTDLAGYIVYWSPVSGVYSSNKDVGNITSVNIQAIAGNLKGNYCFVVTAYDTAGNESDYSNEICSSFVVKKNAPRNLRIQ